TTSTRPVPPLRRPRARSARRVHGGSKRSRSHARFVVARYGCGYPPPGRVRSDRTGAGSVGGEPGDARPKTDDAYGVVPAATGERKSTRLNSSHRTISYAVFCLKKKKNIKLISY